MPSSPSKPCTYSGCHQLVRNGSRCDAHRSAWVKRQPTKRITGRRLQRMRESLFARQPLCELCTAKGRVTAATQRDHKVPLFEGGSDDETNEQAICDECHTEKSLAEALRARRRPPGG